MNANAKVLVATDRAADADLVRKLLGDEFENIAASTDPDHCVQDFDKHRPSVLILAFDSLEKAERYYLGLYRLSPLVHGLPHRTVILCNQDDLHRVYALCKKDYFDDYVLFWPIPHDSVRLPMAVHKALRDLAAGGAVEASATAEFAAAARRMAELESSLEQYATTGGQRMDAASRSLQQAGRDIGAAVDDLSRKMTEGDLRGVIDVKDRPRFQREIERLKADEIDRRLGSVAAAVQPLRHWVGALRGDLAPHVESARALGQLAERVRPLLLVVDDDEFQHKLIARLLADARIEVTYAASAVEALTSLRKRRPDLVLMDVSLPDIDGIEATRRLKSVDQFAGIPVMMITGNSEKHIIVESMKAGACDFVVKPFERDVFLTKVLKHVNESCGP